MINSISVITHVYNQNKELKHFLRGLDKSGFSDELVIVVIGGEDPFELIGESAPYSVKTVYMEKQTTQLLPIGQAKNIGSSVAQGEALLFLDVNHIPSKELVAAFLQAINESPDSIHVGRNAVMKKAPHKNWSFKYLWKNSTCRSLDDKKVKNLDVRTAFKGSNFALRKQLFLELGGFDENFKGTSSNIDFYYEGLKRGVKFFSNYVAVAFELRSGANSKTDEKINEQSGSDPLIDNSAIFFSKWGHFPSGKTLHTFQKRGALKVDEL